MRPFLFAFFLVKGIKKGLKEFYLMGEQRNNDLELWLTGVVLGKVRGFRAWCLRRVLWILSGLYRLAIFLRIAHYAKGWKKAHYFAVPVISVGNLTVGGTGKTPVVERLARDLAKRGKRPAILSRGYKSKALLEPQKWVSRKDKKTLEAALLPKIVNAFGKPLLSAAYAGDEPRMLANNLPQASILVGRDRVRSARFAIKELDVDCLILDDGLQYLELAHSFDIILVDASRPFGTGQMLPAGTLREPAVNLIRADYIFITKCDGGSNEALIEKIRRLNPTASLLECRHGPQSLKGLFGEKDMPLEGIAGKHIALFSGIAMPQSFEKIIEELGGIVDFHSVFSDHHSFKQKELNKLARRCEEWDSAMLITTEKDAVRLQEDLSFPIPAYYLRIEVDILKGKEVWEELLDGIAKPKTPVPSLFLPRGAWE